MHPVIFKLGPLVFYSYGALWMLGAIAGVAIAHRYALSLGRDPKNIHYPAICALPATFLCAKLWLLIASLASYPGLSLSVILSDSMGSGGAYYGGALGGVLAVAFYAASRRISLLYLLDSGVLGLSLGHAVGRLGCFAAGCCYGRPTSLPWAVTFTSSVASRLIGTPTHIPLHPTQLYEAACELANFALLLWLSKRTRFEGQLISTYLVLYGCERLALEFLRGDPGRTMLFANSVSLMQIVSLALIIVGVTLWFKRLQGLRYLVIQ